MPIFLDLLAFVFFLAGAVALAGMKSDLQEIVAILAFGFGALMLAASIIIDRLRAAVRGLESWQRPGEP